MKLVVDPGPRGLGQSDLARATFVIRTISLIILAAIGFGIAQIWLNTEQRAQADFNLNAREQIHAVQTELIAAAGAAETAGRFAAISDRVDPIGFSGFLGGITVQYPWIAAIEWVPKIDHEQRRSFVAAARPELPGYQIRDRAPDGHLIAAPPRPVYFPITLVEPLTVENRVVGLDLGAIPQIRRNLDAAAATGEATASDVVTGAKEVANGSAIVLAWPVYNDVPVRGLAPALWRHQNLRGFALAVVDVSSVLDHAGAQSADTSMTMSIVAPPDSGSTGSGDPAVLAVTSPVSVGGHTWWFRVSAARQNYLPSPIVIELARGAVLLLVAVVLVAGIAARSVVKRSIVIRRLHLEMAATAAFSRDILDTLREPVVIVDAEMAVITANRAWDQWQESREISAAAGGRYLDLMLRPDLALPKAHETALSDAIDMVLCKGADDRECDIETISPDGVAQWFTIRIRAFSYGSARHALIAHSDISRLKQAEDELRQLAITDGLTQVANRRHFDDRILEEIDRSQRYDRPLVLMLLDIDHFKRVNDTYGHPAGDAVLRRVADVCRSSTRTLDLVARFGGEEFAILLLETGTPGAIQLAERIREEIAEMPIVYGRHTIRVTVSIGVAPTEAGPLSAEHLLKAADEMLYAAKQSGRNRVICYTAATKP